MLRSFVAPSRPLLSRLLRRNDRRLVAQLGHRADGIQSRGYSYTSSEDETDSDVDRPEARSHRRKQHLYMVLDDWNKGFSIHKLDLGDHQGSDSDVGGDLTTRPPVHRQVTGNRCWNFAAVGSKIVAAGRVMQSNKDDYVTLVYDTEAAGLSIVPRLPGPLREGWALATAVAGNRLYTFDKISYLDGKYNGGMHILKDAPAPADDKYGRAFWWGNTDHWSWRSISTPPPFPVDTVESVAVHPAEGGGRTLFVSVGEWNNVLDIDGNIPAGDTEEEVNQRRDRDDGRRLMRTPETFSYDTKTREWTRHGDWDLPFQGQAHYDVELDAWVGLRKVYEPHHYWTDGYLCSCDVPSPDVSAKQQPAWKLCAEGLFDPSYTCPTDVEATLLSMGGSSNYCLVQVMACEKFKTKHCMNVGRKCVIRVTTFRLKYGKKGELIVTARRPDRSFHFSGFYETPKTHAFWM